MESSPCKLISQLGKRLWPEVLRPLAEGEGGQALIEGCLTTCLQTFGAFALPAMDSCCAWRKRVSLSVYTLVLALSTWASHFPVILLSFLVRFHQDPAGPRFPLH